MSNCKYKKIFSISYRNVETQKSIRLEPKTYQGTEVLYIQCIAYYNVYMHVHPVLQGQAPSPSANQKIKIKSSAPQCMLPAQTTGHQLLLLRKSQVATESPRTAEVTVPLIPAHPLLLLVLELLLLLLLLLLDYLLDYLLDLFTLHTSQIVSPDIVRTPRRAGPARGRTAPLGHARLVHVPAAVVVLQKRLLEGIDVGRNGELTHVVDALGGIAELVRDCVRDEARGWVDAGPGAGTGAGSGLLDAVVWVLVVFALVVRPLAARPASTKPGLPGWPRGYLDHGVWLATGALSAAICVVVVGRWSWGWRCWWCGGVGGRTTTAPSMVCRLRHVGCDRAKN
jgi:hypothetical protein